jgi:hypothetical protein
VSSSAYRSNKAFYLPAIEDASWQLLADDCEFANADRVKEKPLRKSASVEM